MDLFNFFSKKSNSGQTAKSRLKFVLIQDRMNCSAQVLEMLKTDILKVISKYMEIDEDSLDIQVQNKSGGRDAEPSIYFDIPIKSIKTEHAVKGI